MVVGWARAHKTTARWLEGSLVEAALFEIMLVREITPNYSIVTLKLRTDSVLTI